MLVLVLVLATSGDAGAAGAAGEVLLPAANAPAPTRTATKIMVVGLSWMRFMTEDE